MIPRSHVVAAMVGRDYQIRRTYGMALALDLLIGMFSLLVYFFISRALPGMHGHNLHGAPSYFAFAAVGVALSVVVQGACAGVSIRMREEQLTGTLEALATQPVTTVEMSAGMAGFPFLFATARVAVYLLAADLLLGLGLRHASWVGFAAVLLAAGAAVAGLGIGFAALVVVIKRGEGFATLAVVALGFLSGAYFPISVLPGWLQPLGHVVPTRYAFDGVRAALFQGRGWAGDALALLAFAAVALPLAVWMFDRALGRAKASGTLAEY